MSAPTREDAVILLDEWGDAEQASLKRMPDCMFDFRLSNDGQIKLSNIGEATDGFIMQTCYPELESASMVRIDRECQRLLYRQQSAPVPAHLLFRVA